MDISQNNTINDLVNSSNSKLAKGYLLHLSNNSEKIFIFEDKKEHSGKKIISKIIKFCNVISKNDSRVVLISSNNTIDWVLFYLAAKLKNKIIFIIPSTTGENIVSALVENYDISIILKDSKLIKIKSSIKKPLDLKFFKNDHIYDCIFTTGTTGQPKGVIINENAYMHIVKALIKKSQQKENDVELLSMPLSHSFGLARLRVCIYNKQSFHISDGLKDFPAIYKRFINNEINGIALVPSAIEILRVMLRSNSSKFGSYVKYMEIGSSPLSFDSRKWLKDNFKKANIFHHYGMTEASRSFFIDRGYKDNLRQKKNYVGRTCSKLVKFKLDKSAGNNSGEIMIKGPHLADGFFSLDSINDITPIKGWLGTKDIGIIKNNKLMLVGRLNSMINVGGQKVYPEEIEEFVEGMKGVNTSLCSCMDDDVLGEVPVLMVCVDNNLFKSKDLANKEIKAYFKKMPSHKKPKKIVFVDNIPLAKGGKKIRDKNLLKKFLI
tara:strand:- start:4081 stop:5556 length:1476 start_codon:yes stop_codon:yes gene_type:complete